MDRHIILINQNDLSKLSLSFNLFN